MVAQTWDPARINAANTLSNGNLTATNNNATGNDYPGYAVNSFTTGKYYWETVLTGSGTMGGAGIGNTSSVTTSGTYVGKDTTAIGYFPSAGQVLNNNAVLVTWTTYVSGDRLCHALDLTNSKYWVRVGTGGNWNNNAAGDPTNSTSAGNLTIPAGVTAHAMMPAFETVSNATPDQLIAYFSTASWVGTPPAGFITMDTGDVLHPAGWM